MPQIYITNHSILRLILKMDTESKNIVINPWNLFHCPPYNIQQLIRNCLLTTLIVLLCQILNQLVCIVRSHLHSQGTRSMFRCIRVDGSGKKSSGSILFGIKLAINSSAFGSMI